MDKIKRKTNQKKNNNESNQSYYLNSFTVITGLLPSVFAWFQFYTLEWQAKIENSECYREIFFENVCMQKIAKQNLFLLIEVIKNHCFSILVIVNIVNAIRYFRYNKGCVKFWSIDK